MNQGFIILILLSFFTGIVAGYLSGLLGIGSGIILVPVSIFLLQIDFREAKALSLFVIMFTSLLGMLRHRSHGNLHLMTGVYLGIPAVIGCLLGVYIAGKTDTTILQFLFALLLFYAAYRMIFIGKGFIKMKDIKEAYKTNRKFLPITGLFGGIAAGLLGVGGGIIMVPSMVFLSYPMHSAVANSLMVIFLNSTAATIAHAIIGKLEILKALPMTVGAILSVHKGADMCVSIDRKRLRKYFGIFMILMGIYMLFKSLF